MICFSRVLKSHYKIQQAADSTYPELLQGIYTFRPSVFNSSVNIRKYDQKSKDT